MDDLDIGNFSKPLAPKPSPAATPPVSQGSPEAEKLSAIDKRLESQAQEVESALRPKADYEKQLQEAGITKEEAAKIVDDVLLKGVYSEEVTITSRIKVTLRTRQARDTSRTMNYLEIQKPTYDNHYNELLAKHTLAASLEKLGKDRFEFPARDASADDHEKAFQARFNFVNGLPDPVLRLLFSKVAKFDEKIRVVLQEGAIENF